MYVFIYGFSKWVTKKRNNAGTSDYLLPQLQAIFENAKIETCGQFIIKEGVAKVVPSGRSLIQCYYVIDDDCFEGIVLLIIGGYVMILNIRSMKEGDIDIIMKNYIEQGWSKPKEVLEKYLENQNSGFLYMFAADYNNDIAGYTVLYPDTGVGPFAFQKIPVISDFIVFEKYQRQGIGTKMLDEAEMKAFELNDRVQLGVGLHSGYGSAQRIYIKRGYVPDGTGVWWNNTPLEQYADCKNNDELVLFLIKDLRR